MPIRINLLAEAQAVEELRRRDPVKRAIWAAFLVVCLFLLWIFLLWAKIITDNSHLGSLEARLSLGTNQYNTIIQNQNKLRDATDKLEALNRFATNRLLEASILDTLQHSTVEGIQIIHLRTEESFDILPETKPSTTESGRPIPGKPGTSTEHIKLFIDAKDSSPLPGTDKINKFKDALAGTAYFRAERVSTNDIVLKSVGSPQPDNETGRPYVLFSFECRYPDRVR